MSHEISIDDYFYYIKKEYEEVHDKVERKEVICICKKNLNTVEFAVLINAELTAFHVYKRMIKKKIPDEYVDVIYESYATVLLVDAGIVETLYKASEILKKDYNVDMFKLPFKSLDLKNEVLNYEPIKKISTSISI